MSLKAAVLVGGPQKGTRFRPLSLQLPKPLFPIAGVPLIEHHIDQLSKLEDLKEIFLIGFYPSEQFDDFVKRCASQYGVNVKYLEEKEASGTAGGLYHFSSQVLDGNPRGILVLNADVCGDLPISDMVSTLDKTPEAQCLILTTEATRDQSVKFGSVVIDSTGKVLHYVEKPTTFVSQHISCGVYLLRPSVIYEIGRTSKESGTHQVWFETEIFPRMAADSTLYALRTNRWWSQTKTPSAVLYANRHYLRLYRESNSSKLCKDRAEIIGDVYIDPSAKANNFYFYPDFFIHPTATIGPNVSIGANAQIGSGVRLKESIVLGEAVLNEHCCVLHSVIGWRSVVGAWARVEGTPISPNPNIPFAKLDNKPLFNTDGRLAPSPTILGSDVDVSPEIILLNSIVLPYKELNTSYANQIIL